MPSKTGQTPKVAGRRRRARTGDRLSKKKMRVVDARGGICPVPTVKTALVLEKCSEKEIVDVRADDPTTRRDLPVWCREFGHRVVGIFDGPNEFRIRIEKGPTGGDNK